jgi:FkbM family methyltransferase
MEKLPAIDALRPDSNNANPTGSHNLSHRSEGDKKKTGVGSGLGSNRASNLGAEPVGNNQIDSNTVLKEYQSRIAVVMGNGPSAKALDFDQLRSGQVATVGMNVAYRYWDRIDFRPTHYICMDTVVLMSHAKRIVEMIKEGRIKKFFLRDELKELYPELATDKRILWFKDATDDNSGIFDTTLITTGSWAIRWMLKEGMELVACIGIDANYVELITEARRMGKDSDLRLEITQTPEFNPNYFFSDYQQQGDKYNIPNSPHYFREKGCLVHVEALRQVQEDVARLGCSTRILDCSPISNHGAFLKEDLSTFWEKIRLAIVTSFHTHSDTDLLENNLTMVIANCSNSLISGVHVFLEGELDQLKKKVNRSIFNNINALEHKKRLKIIQVKWRPSYGELFEYANSINASNVAIVNSDILLDSDTAARIVSGRYAGGAPLYALTRWNHTANGYFVQGRTPSPPWPEIPLGDLTFKEKNYFSYDTYVLSPPIRVPQSIEKILIGSFGCDTSLVAVLKAEGFKVSNPCLSFRTIHIDDKPRNYGEKSVQLDLSANIKVTRRALLSRYSVLPKIYESLRNLETLRREIVWIGGTNTKDPWYSLFRALGATPWSETDSTPAFRFRKIVINIDNVAAEGDEILGLLDNLDKENLFIEWELSGGINDIHVVDLLSANRKFCKVGEQLKPYPWQSMIHVDRATNQERSIHSDLLLILRDVLNSKSSLHPQKPISLQNTLVTLSYEREAHAYLDETKVISFLLGPSSEIEPVMIDVGAHFGSSAQHFVDKAWRIYCFEPDSNNRKHLISKFGDRKNITIDSRAVGESVESQAAYYASEVSTGISGMLAFHESHKLVDTVNVTTVANIVADNNIGHVNFLKIDVEGYDFSVLKGVPWARITPEVIECEFEDAKTKCLGHSWKDICEYLVEKGYTIYVSEWHPIIRYGTRHDWRQITQYPCELADSNGWGNLLAFKNDPGTTVIHEALQKVLTVKYPKKINDPTESQNVVLAKGKHSVFNILGESKAIMRERLFGPFSSYSHFVEWIKSKSLTLFRIGQFAKWVLRFLKQHPLASALALVLWSMLVLMPIVFPIFAFYGGYFWTAAVLLMFPAIIMLGISFGNKIMMEFAEQEQCYRQALRAEMLRELKKGEGKIGVMVEEQKQQHVQRHESLDQKFNQLDQNFKQFVGSAPIFNFSDYQPFNRRLTKAHIDVLQQEWSRKLSCKVTSKSLAYLAHRICTLESAAKGRLATTIEDIVLRVLVASAVKSKNLRVVEIGTLFGIGLAAIYDHTSFRFNSVHLTAIDPLDGYYDKDIRDIVTDEEISESIFRGNLARAGVADSDITLIKAMSTDTAAIEAATKLSHDVLIIDGDHSFAGVQADFVNYLPAVKRGGYIIFDDYDAPDWPDIKKFLDTSVRDNSDVTLVGISWRTAVFQVVRPEIIGGQPVVEK